VHYRKIWLFRAPIMCHGSTHGIENSAVSRPAQRTANKNRTANLKETHDKISAHGGLRLKLTAKPGTRQNLQETHGKQTPTANWCIGPTYAANLTARPNGQHCAVSLAVTHGKMFNFQFPHGGKYCLANI
jgi:hypothetical protein